MDRRAFAYLVPYWRRLVLVLVISLISTATTLFIPYLSKDLIDQALIGRDLDALRRIVGWFIALGVRSEEHTSELQSQSNLVCRLLLEKKKNYINTQLKFLL